MPDDVERDRRSADAQRRDDHVDGDLDRRRPGQSKLTTPRDEADRVEILSGVFEGRTTGTPIGLNKSSGAFARDIAVLAAFCSGLKSSRVMLT